MKKPLFKVAMFVCLVGAFVYFLVVLIRAPEPVEGGKRISCHIKEIRGVALKIVESPQMTQVFLGNLSDEEVFRLKPWNPKVFFVTRNMGVVFPFYTNGLDGVFLGLDSVLDDDPATQAIKRLGPKALPWLISALHRRDSKAVDFFNLQIWPRLPARLQSAMGRPRHPAHVRLNSAYALGLLGAAAKQAVPDLKKLLGDSSPAVRAAALEALQRIDPAEVVSFHPDIFARDMETAHSRLLGGGNEAVTISPWRPNSGLIPDGVAQQNFLESELQTRNNRPGRTRDVDVIEPLWHLKNVGLLPEREP